MERRRKTTLANELARPVLGLVLLGILWIAYEISILDMIGRALIAPLATN